MKLEVSTVGNKSSRKMNQESSHKMKWFPQNAAIIARVSAEGNIAKEINGESTLPSFPKPTNVKRCLYDKLKPAPDNQPACVVCQ